MDHPKQPHTFFSNNPNSGLQANQRKRGGDLSTPSANDAAFRMMPPPQLNINPTSSSSNAAAFQMMPTPQLNPNPSVSTNLHLMHENKNHSNPSMEEQLRSVIDQQTAEIEQYWNSQVETLRRTLVQKQMAGYRALLTATKGWAAKKLSERDIEINRAAMRAAELEILLAKIHDENLAWRAKALSDEEKIASLQAKIQQQQLASVGRTPCEGESGVEDRVSVCEDPDRAKVGESGRPCRACGKSEVSVVIVPCLHLCLCNACEADFTKEETVRCPVCNVVRTGGVLVFYS